MPNRSISRRGTVFHTLCPTFPDEFVSCCAGRAAGQSVGRVVCIEEVVVLTIVRLTEASCQTIPHRQRAFLCFPVAPGIFQIPIMHFPKAFALCIMPLPTHVTAAVRNGFTQRNLRCRNVQDVDFLKSYERSLDFLKGILKSLV